MSTDDEIRKILGGRDIEILCALNDMDGGGNRHFDFLQVYEQMGLGAFNLPLERQDRLLP